jgi:hypothetical protein
LSRKKKRSLLLRRKLSRSRARHTRKKSLKIKRLISRKVKKSVRRVRRVKKPLLPVRLKRRLRLKRRVHHVIKKKKRVITRKRYRKVVSLKLTRKKAPFKLVVVKGRRQKLKQKQKLKKRRQIVRVTERRKFSTRLDFSKSAAPIEKLKYLIKKIHDGMILRFVIKAPKGKGSPTKRAKKTGKVIRRSPYISTGWINFGSLTPERIEYYLEQLGGVDRIERIFYMPKR